MWLDIYIYRKQQKTARYSCSIHWEVELCVTPLVLWWVCGCPSHVSEPGGTWEERRYGWTRGIWHGSHTQLGEQWLPAQLGELKQTMKSMSVSEVVTKQTGIQLDWAGNADALWLTAPNKWWRNWELVVDNGVGGLRNIVVSEKVMPAQLVVTVILDCCQWRGTGADVMLVGVWAPSPTGTNRRVWMAFIGSRRCSTYSKWVSFECSFDTVLVENMWKHNLDKQFPVILHRTFRDTFFFRRSI